MDLFRSSARRSTSSKNVAKERLKLVLVHDRVNVSSTFLEMIKGDLIKVISDYMEIDEDNPEVRMTKTKRDEGRYPGPGIGGKHTDKAHEGRYPMTGQPGRFYFKMPAPGGCGIIIDMS